jgi:hypothetical protein
MKNKGFIALAMLAVFAAGFGDGFASARRLGTAGASELLIPMGARAIGIAGADIAALSGTDALFHNPAGLAGIGGTEFGFNYMSYFADMNISYLSLGTKIGRSDAVGFSLQAMDVGDIPVTTIESPEGTGEILSPTFFTLSASYSRQFTDRIRFGVTGKLVSERMADMNASAMALDAGLQYRSPLGVDIGVVMRNYGTNLKFNGTSIEFNSEVPWANPNATTRKTKLDMGSHELPANLGMGLSYRREFGSMHEFNAAAMYLSNSYAFDEIHAGAEYAFKKLIFLRAGYQAVLYPSDHPEDAKESEYGLTLGFGIKIPVNGKSVRFDYAYRSMDIFKPNQCFGISVGL